MKSDSNLASLCLLKCAHGSRCLARSHGGKLCCVLAPLALSLSSFAVRSSRREGGRQGGGGDGGGGGNYIQTNPAASVTTARSQLNALRACACV